MSTEFHSLNIAAVEKLTKDAIAVTFDVPDKLEKEYQYIQGQHLTLKAMIDGKDVRRSYSICNSVQQQKLTVGIKQIPQGVFSTYANDNLKKGMLLDVMPPQGNFHTQLSVRNKKNYLLIAVGSGITPNLSHAESILQIEPNSTVTLIYGNKSTSLMMFREKLSFLKNQYLIRFHWFNYFTQEENDASLFNGRISSEKLLTLDGKLIDLKSFDDAFVCGPESMINDIAECLKDKGFSEKNIHFELFFSGASDEIAQKNQAERAEKYAGKVSKVSVKVAGRKTMMELSMDGENILDAAMAHGADLPFSCKGGVCATCKAKVIKGKVEMDSNFSLGEQEVANGMILTCQAHPVSQEVEVDFDFS